MRESIKNLFLAIMVLMALILFILTFTVFYTIRSSGSPRARTPRAFTEVYSLNKVVQSFWIEHNCFPKPTSSYQINNAHVLIDNRIHTLTTPIAFVNDIPRDPYKKEGGFYRYYSDGSSWYVIASNGPDEDEDIKESILAQIAEMGEKKLVSKEDLSSYYFEPSNGLQSNGDILLLGPNHKPHNTTNE